MTKEQRNLHLGIADFAKPTLLLIGDADSFNWLAEQLALQRGVTLDRGSTKGRVSLEFIPVAHAGRMSRQGDVYAWHISETEAQLVVQQLRELAASDCPAHAYLDPTVNEIDIQIVASVGEYEPVSVFAE